jgi:hypothetical protein
MRGQRGRKSRLQRSNKYITKALEINAGGGGGGRNEINRAKGFFLEYNIRKIENTKIV